MKTEKLLESVCVLIREHDMSEGGEKMAEQAIAHPETFDASWPFYGAACALLTKVREELDAETTPRKVSAAVRRMLNPDNMQCTRYPGLFEHNGRWIYCDGARLLRFSADITSVPHWTRDQYIDPDEIMSGVNTSGEKMPIPEISALKAFIAEEKARTGARKYKRFRRYYCWNECVYVSPERLIDMLEALPGCVAYKPKNAFSPIYFEAKNGDGILMPCRPPKEDAD